jgi:hypothetical protein
MLLFRTGKFVGGFCILDRAALSTYFAELLVIL